MTCGNYDTSYAVDTLTVSHVARVEHEPGPIRTRLTARPNPSGTDIEISYTVPGRPGDATLVSIVVYDVKGRGIRRPADGIEGPGPRRVTWDGQLAEGNPAPSGIYFIKMTVRDGSVVRKAALVR
jgi:flagellar hook assembly protein FlgD